MPSSPRDVWANGSAYERYVGRWSRLVASRFLTWINVPSSGRWLDVGCGTGELGRAILRGAAPTRVDGLDHSFAYVAFAREQTLGAFLVADAQAFPLASGTFDAVVSGLALNFVPQPERAAHEMARVARRGGVVASYVWDYAGGMEFLRHFWDAASELDPGSDDLDEGRRFPICNPEPFAAVFRLAGLSAVEVRPIVIPTIFGDFDDYWQPFTGGQGPAPSYLMTLDADRQSRLRALVRARLPIAADGTIPLQARAWAVRGLR